MSGIIVNNVARASGTIAATPGGLDWSADVVTASTVTVEAGRGYFINTTSNACTVTLPASPEAGNQIVLADYARTWATNAVTIDSNGNNFQGNADTYTVNYDTVGQSLNIVYADSTKGWLPVSDDAVADVGVAPTIQKGMFAYGNSGSVTNLKNLLGSNGVIAADVTGVGTSREWLAAATYGGDKVVFAYGNDGSNKVSLKNLGNNSGVIASDVTGVGTAREQLAAATYGTDKAIFAYGRNDSDALVDESNLVNNVGTIASDVTGVGLDRRLLAATGYGEDKAIFAYGYSDAYQRISNLVSNVGVIASDVTGVGTIRGSNAAVRYGTDTAMFAYGSNSGGKISLKNLVSNSGVVAADVSGVGTARSGIAASSYGGDKAAFAYGDTGSKQNVKNLVAANGTIASDVTGVGTARSQLAAAGYSFSA